MKVICLSLVSYLLTDALFAILGLIPVFPWRPAHIIQEIASPEIHLPSANVLASVLMGIAIACLLTKADYHNWLFGIANAMNLTDRTDDKTVWDRVFDDGKVVILRDMVTTNIYYGEVYIFSDDKDRREIIFYHVRVYDQMSNFLYHADTLYLSREHNQFTIETQESGLFSSDDREGPDDGENKA